MIIDKIIANKSKFQRYHQLKALLHQKEVLGHQIKQLLHETKKINGYVEIGSPGTYISGVHNAAKLTGKKYVINDIQRATDFLQSFSFNPFKSFLNYDTFVALRDYAQIEESDIPSNSVDLIVCFIGLHHIPVEKLKGFVASIARILKPGGILLLRDHDCINDTIHALVNAAHSVYNAVMTQETLASELNEYRNFQPLLFWIDLLENHGLKVDSPRLLQEGDPTLNTMIRCIKTTEIQDEIYLQIERTLKTQDATYERDSMQTYLSAPEWFNVDQAQEYGAFIEHTPFYEFPYIKNIQSYWRIFRKSFNAARKKAGTMNVFMSSYTLMNLFVGVSMTIEYGIKSLISAPIRFLYSGEELATIKVLLRDNMNEMAALGTDVKVLKNYSDSAIFLVELPRYKKFLETLTLLSKTNMELLEIAGNKAIQCKVRYRKNFDLETCLSSLQGCCKEYDWLVPTKPDYIYAELAVEVTQLKKVMNNLSYHGVEILYVHDF